jgi:hypothetical protein
LLQVLVLSIPKDGVVDNYASDIVIVVGGQNFFLKEFSIDFA